MGIKVKLKGSFKNTEKYLDEHPSSIFTKEQIYEIAEKALELFQKNTPTSSGKTAMSWSYEVKQHNGSYEIIMHNSNIQNGYSIAILLNDGHATASGKYISGTHYIEDTMKDIFKFIDSIQ